MVRKIGNGGAFWVSYDLETKEGKKVAFYYGWESAIPEVVQKIISKYPNYFVLENNNDLWVKPEAEKKITLDELKDAVSLDETDSMVLLDLSDNSVLAGVEDWVDPDDIKDI